MIDIPTGLEANEIATDAVLTAGTVELAKRAGVPTQLAGILALAIALGFGLLRYQFTALAIFHGVISALAATGVYEFATNTAKIARPAGSVTDGE